MTVVHIHPFVGQSGGIDKSLCHAGRSILALCAVLRFPNVLILATADDMVMIRFETALICMRKCDRV